MLGRARRVANVGLLTTNNRFTKECVVNRFYSSDRISIDTSQLNKNTYSPVIEGVREEETALIKYLKTKIKGTGPVSVATFIHEALLNPRFGYYYTAGRSFREKETADDQHIFGERGDFVTSPEISQMFGELVGIWAIETWSRLGKPKQLQIVELGPGKGTLMHDLLLSISKLASKQQTIIQEFLSAEVSVHMVEASPQLQQVQRNTLIQQPDTNKTYCDIPVYWHDAFDRIPEQGAVLLVAHEFFDALPVFQFQYTEKGWREVLVDINDDAQTTAKEHFKFVLAPAKTFANMLIRLSDVEEKVGNKLEISPASMGVMEQIGIRLAKQKGAALVIDYGKDEQMGFTLQGIKNHKFTSSPLESPGLVDLSCHVDFSALKVALKKNTDVTSWGPLQQNYFLKQMGIDLRLMQLLKNPAIDDETASNIFDSYKRLVDEEGMGSQYKVLCVTSGMNEPPAGFEVIPETKPAPSKKQEKQPKKETSTLTNKVEAPEKPVRASPKGSPKPQSIHKRKPNNFM